MKNRKQVLGHWVCAALAVAGVLVPVRAPADVKIRTGDHPGYRRLVFDWPQPVSFKQTQDGDRLIVTFDRTADIDVAAVQKKLAGYVNAVEASEGKTIFVFKLAQPAVVKSFKNGKSVVMDFTRRPLPVTQPQPQLQIQPQPPALPAPVSEQPPTVALAQAKEEQTTLPEGSVIRVGLTLGAQSASLSFAWPVPVAAAVFQRAETLWVVFEQKAPFDLEELRKNPNPLVTFVDQNATQDATVLRLRVQPGVSPSVWRKGTAWNIDLRQQQFQVAEDLTLVPEPKALPDARLLVRLDGSRRPVSVFDPAFGDRLWVVLTHVLNYGSAKTRQYQEFSILQAVQGYAVTTLADEVTLALLEQGTVAVTASTGLHISETPLRASSIKTVNLTADTLYPFAQWLSEKGENFFEIKQKFQRRIDDAPQSQKNVRRLEMAQYLFAKGYILEAGGILKNIVAEDPTAANTVAVLSLRGAVDLLQNDIENATALLFNPGLDRFKEIALWRGVVKAMAGARNEALLWLDKTRGIPAGYPARMAVPLALTAADIYLEQKDVAKAKVFLDDLSVQDTTTAQKQRIRYMHGLALKAEGNMHDAKKIWESLQESDDQWSRVRATTGLLLLKLADNSMARPDVIKGLERIRFGWRGDNFEFTILAKLGELYLQEKDYRKGFQMLGQILERFPEHPQAAEVSALRERQFLDLYLGKASDTLSPITALALYDEFRALTPEGEKGDEMIRRLADRLVSVDLLDRASELLMHQVRERLTGVEKGRVGARLALIRLLDHNPDEAIEALNLSDMPEMQDALARERGHLRARALMMKQNLKQALALIEGDASRPADQLRSEIYWQQKDYPKLIQVFERLITVTPQDKVADEKQAQYILNLAIALALNQDYDTLEALRAKYQPLLQNTIYAKAFLLVSRPPEETTFTSYQDIAGRFKEIQEFESFLEEYRTRLKTGKLSDIH